MAAAMHVSVICTVHEERGAANVEALEVILEQLTPDTVFAEVPPDEIARYRDGSLGTLESMAVARFAARSEAALVAVDLPWPSRAFFSSVEELFRKIERTSPAYRQLVDDMHNATCQGGFPYLCGDQCASDWRDIYSEARDTMAWMGQAESVATFASWTEQHRRRDTAMVSAITNYAVARKGKRGVLLVGSAHRDSLMAIAGELAGRSVSAPEWRVAQPFSG